MNILNLAFLEEKSVAHKVTSVVFPEFIEEFVYLLKLLLDFC